MTNPQLFIGTKKSESGKAIEVELTKYEINHRGDVIGFNRDSYWLPKSQIDVDYQFGKNGETLCFLRVPEWLVKNKRMSFFEIESKDFNAIKFYLVKKPTN